MKFGLNDTRPMFIMLYYVAVNTEGSIIYMSNGWTGTVTALATLYSSINVTVTTYRV